MRKPAIARIPLGALAAAVCALALLGIPASAAAAASPPTIESESVSSTTEHDATLEAQIDPGGLATTYHFQIAKSPACLPVPPPFMPCGLVEAGNLPTSGIPFSSGSQLVSLDLASAGMSLEPGVTYRFRVVATNGVGKTEGQAQTFTTTSKPLIESESVSNVTSTDATLEAQINPGGLATHYRFHLAYGCGLSPQEACPQFCIAGQPCPGPWNSVITVPLPSGDLPPTTEIQHVSLDLNSVGVTLQPYKYRYSIEATNAAGIVVGAAQFFTPASSPPPPTDSPPSIESESVSNVTSTDATLEAEVNLHEAAAGAYYQFQLVADPGEYATEILCPPTLQPGIDGCIGPQGAPALPIGFLPGNTLQPSATSHASLDLASAGVTLQPKTTYHYRVLVARRVQTEDTIEWEEPTVFGADQTFTTSSESPRPTPLTVQDPTGVQSSSTTTPAAASHRRHRRGHKRRRHRVALHRASRAG